MAVQRYLGKALGKMRGNAIARSRDRAVLQGPSGSAVQRPSFLEDEERKRQEAERIAAEQAALAEQARQREELQAKLAKTEEFKSVVDDPLGGAAAPGKKAQDSYMSPTAINESDYYLVDPKTGNKSLRVDIQDKLKKGEITPEVYAILALGATDGGGMSPDEARAFFDAEMEKKREVSESFAEDAGQWTIPLSEEAMKKTLTEDTRPRLAYNDHKEEGSLGFLPEFDWRMGMADSPLLAKARANKLAEARNNGEHLFDPSKVLVQDNWAAILQDTGANWQSNTGQFASDVSRMLNGGKDPDLFRSLEELDPVGFVSQLPSAVAHGLLGMASIPGSTMSAFGDSGTGATLDAVYDGDGRRTGRNEVRDRTGQEQMASNLSASLDAGSLINIGGNAMVNLGKAAAKGIPAVMKAIAKGGLPEMATELKQTELDAIADRSEPTVRDFFNAGATGFLTGGAVGGLSQAAGNIRSKGKNPEAPSDTGVSIADPAEDAGIDVSQAGLAPMATSVGEDAASAVQPMPAPMADPITGTAPLPMDAMAAAQQTAPDPSQAVPPLSDPMASMAAPMADPMAGPAAAPLSAPVPGPAAAPMPAPSSEAMGMPMSAPAARVAPVPEPSRAAAPEAGPMPVPETTAPTAAEAAPSAGSPAPAPDAAAPATAYEPRILSMKEASRELPRVVEGLKSDAASVTVPEIEDIVYPLAESRARNSEAVRSKAMDVDDATEAIVDAWTEAIMADPASFPSTTLEIVAKLESGRTDPAAILRGKGAAEAPADTAPETAAEKAEESPGPAKAPEAAAEKAGEAAEAPEAGKKEPPRAEPKPKAEPEEKAKPETKAEPESETKAESKAEAEPEGKKAKDDSGDEAKADGGPLGKGYKKEGSETRGIEESRADVDAFVSGRSNREVVEFLEEVMAGDSVLNSAQYNRFLELMDDGKVDVKPAFRKKFAAKAKRHIREAASELALAKKLRAEQIISGVMSPEDAHRFFKEEFDSITNMSWTDEGLAELNSAKFEYAEAAKLIFGASRQAKAAYRPGSSKSQVKEARKQLIDAAINLNAVVGKFNVTVMNEIAKVTDTNVRLNAAFQFEGSLRRNFGLYFHDYIDSNLLSAPAGRLFDQLNGWSVNLEQMLPLTRLFVDPLTKKLTGNSGGIAGSGSLRRGAIDSIKQTWSDAKVRQDLIHSKQMGFAGTQRNVTTTLVQLGDNPIQANALSKTTQYYAETKGLRKDQAELLAILDRIRRADESSSVYRTFESLAAAEQGLGSSNYSASTHLRRIVYNGLTSRGLFDNHPRIKENIARQFDRWALGFWNVTRRITEKSLSKATFGLPQFIKAVNSTKPGSIERTVAIRQGILDAKSGGELMALGFTLASIGAITGPYPEDPHERSNWEWNGIQPWSVSINGAYVELPRLFGVFAIPAMAGAALHAGFEEGRPFEDCLSLVWSFVAESAGVESIMGSLEALSDVLDKEAGSPAQTGLASFVKMLFPLSSLQNFAANADPVKRDTYSNDFIEGFGKKLLNGTFGRFLLLTKTDWTGEEIANTSPMFRLFGITSLNRNRDGTVAATLDRLREQDLHITPTNYRNEIKANGEKAKLTAEQQYILDNAIGAEKYHQMEVFLNSVYAEGITDQELAAELTAIMNVDNASIKLRLAQEWGFVSGLEEYTGGEALNNALTDDEYAAMLKYDALPEEAREKWLEDNDNAYYYHMGEYNNARLNGTLANDDEELQYGGNDSKLYKYKVAEFNYLNDVDPGLWCDYVMVGQTAWEEMLEDDPERAMLLYDYDTARTEAGLSARGTNHSKRKYTMKEPKGSGGYGRGGGGGGGGGSASLHVPSLSDLKTELYTPKGNRETVSSITKTKGSVAPVSLTAKKTRSAGKGIKTEPANFAGAKTIKYEKAKTRQPAMGSPYMDYLKGKPTQDSFKAARRYV